MVVDGQVGGVPTNNPYKLDTMAIAKLDLDEFSKESQSSESLHFGNMEDDIEDGVGEVEDREEHDIASKVNVNAVVS